MADSTETPPTRELAAIMFSDVVGYTAIMGRDEDNCSANSRVPLSAKVP